ncbi:hypothetical protein [Hydrogenibacillus sp. N12]|uniref:hypothetical protein n=1 Tax=Hydrogenibacillus sp. N12 TaxID=2866627 RepID=UPI001C7CC896|nr:hypothetical protein [Hydrogenibacillus sp. N12]QZA33351.1 hypothetical protein K2M58_01975 [Hydrogenibacillus sp. N12]
MAVAYAHAVRYIGRPVWVLTKDGRRLHGIVHHVTPTHLYLRPFAPAPVGPVVRPMGAEGRTDVVPLGAASGQTTVDVSTSDVKSPIAADKDSPKSPA